MLTLKNIRLMEEIALSEIVMNRMAKRHFVETEYLCHRENPETKAFDQRLKELGEDYHRITSLGALPLRKRIFMN